MRFAFTRLAARKCCNGRRSMSAIRGRARHAYARPRSASITSTRISAAACTSWRCPPAWASEGAGVVEAVGAGVTDVKAGDRVAYCGGPPGAYAEVRVMPADRLVKLPDGVSERTRGDADAQGTDRPVSAAPNLSAQGRRNDPVACRRRRHRPHRLPMGAGARGDDDRHGRLRRRRRRIAKANGCAHTIVYTRENFVERVKADHRRQGRAGRLRQRRQGHVSGVARLPEPARHAGELRQLLRADRRLRYPAAVAEGLALRDAADARDLHCDAPGPAGDGGGDVRSGQARESSSTRRGRPTRSRTRRRRTAISRRARRPDRPCSFRRRRLGLRARRR